MKKYLITLVALASITIVKAQDNILPASAYSGFTYIKNGTVHTGTGTVLQNTSILIKNGKIENIAADIPMPTGDVRMVDATGMQVYPGFIISNTTIGLREIGSQVKGSNDYNELGELNPNVKSVVAYNTESCIRLYIDYFFQLLQTRSIPCSFYLNPFPALYQIIWKKLSYTDSKR